MIKMMGATHLAIASFLALIYVYLSGFSSEMKVPIILFLVGSLFPDIDHPKSLFGRPFKLMHIKIKQRGILHTVFPVVIISALLSITGIINGIAFAMGYLLHLILDSLTNAGIKPIEPFSDFKINGSITTGKFVDNAIFIISIIGVGILAFVIFF